MSTGYGDICVPCEYHQRATSTKEDIYNKVEKMTHSADVRDHFSSDIPVLVKWAFAQSGHVVRDGGYA